MRQKLKKKLRIVSAILASLLVITTVSGCSLFPSKSNSSSEKKDLVIWAFDNEDLWKPVFLELKNQLETVNIKYVKKNLDDNYESDSLNSILSGKGPDIWAIPSDWAYRHKDKLTLIPSKTKKENLEDTTADLVKSIALENGSFYGLSPAADPLILYYNNNIFNQIINEYNEQQKKELVSDEEYDRVKELLSTPPNTWNDVLEVNKIITKRSGSAIERAGIALGTVGNIPFAQDILYALMLQNETKMISDQGDLATFNLPRTNSAGEDVVPGKKALEFYVDFSNPNSANYSWNTSMPNTYEAFVQGKVSMIIGYKSLESYFKQTTPTFEYEVANLPQISGTDDEKVVDYAKFTLLTIPKLSENKEVALSIIKRMTQKGDYAQSKGLLFTEKMSNSEPPTISGRANSGVADKIVRTSQTWNKKRYPKEIDSIIRSMIDSVSSGQLSAQIGLDNAASRVTPLLRKDDW